MDVTIYESSEIRAKCSSDGFLAIPVTMTAGAYSEGLILGKVTSGGAYLDYDDADSDGTEVAVGILAHDVAATDSRTAAMYIKGAFLASELTGYDAAVLADIPGSKLVEGVLVL